MRRGQCVFSGQEPAVSLLVQTGDTQRIITNDARCVMPGIVLFITPLKLQRVVSTTFSSFWVGMLVFPDTEADRSIPECLDRCLIFRLFGFDTHFSFLSICIRSHHCDHTYEADRCLTWREVALR